MLRAASGSRLTVCRMMPMTCVGSILQLAPHQVLGDGQREPRELGLDCRVELVERLGQRSDDGLAAPRS